MNMAIQGKLNLTPKEKFILGNYIMAHCRIPEGSRFAKWDEESGGTDVTVAERLREQIPKITMYHVRNLRAAFDLPLEPARLMFIRQRQVHQLTELDELRDKIEALSAHVKTCDVRLKDYDERIKSLEDRYTSPKR